MTYAEKNKLFELEEKIFDFRLFIITEWLSFIALEENPDMESANIIFKELKPNLGRYLKSKESFLKKCFVVVACMNFSLASKIYKLTRKIF